MKPSYNDLINKLPNRYLLSFYLGEMFKRAIEKGYDEGQPQNQYKIMEGVLRKFVSLELDEDVMRRV